MRNEVSIVIPTYNRLESLKRLLMSLTIQTVKPKEVIIVHSNTNGQLLNHIVSELNLKCILISSQPSVTKQRNLGIIQAGGNYILLIDDDIEIPNNYIDTLSSYLDTHKNVIIVSGQETILNKDSIWKPFQEKVSDIKIILNYIFFLPIWTNLKNRKTNNFITQLILKKHLKKGNAILPSGWPIVCNFSSSVILTPIYGLGCAMFRAKSLKNNLFDETLEQHGFGDNYDLALRVNKHKNIHIISQISYRHYKEQSNRLKKSIQYYQRTKALSYLLKKLPEFTFYNRILFLWSLLGNGIYFILTFRLKYFYYNFRVISYTLKTFFI